MIAPSCAGHSVLGEWREGELHCLALGRSRSRLVVHGRRDPCKVRGEGEGVGREGRKGGFVSICHPLQPRGARKCTLQPLQLFPAPGGLPTSPAAPVAELFPFKGWSCCFACFWGGPDAKGTSRVPLLLAKIPLLWGGGGEALCPLLYVVTLTQGPPKGALQSTDMVGPLPDSYSKIREKVLLPCPEESLWGVLLTPGLGGQIPWRTECFSL